ncbi:MAG: BamA/TamA family outer membrane protein [candidate division Zixibacteria bacterium]|nr:BamA/TamA family outer membrane protein [candidate division Zixibacteria bacterium]
MKLFRFTILLVCLLASEAVSVEVICQDCPRSVLKAIEQAVRVVTDSSATDTTVTLLRERGYLDAEAAVIDGKLVLTPGVQFRLQSVSIVGDTASSVSMDRPFTSINLRQAIDKLLERYHREGHYYAAVSVVTVSKVGNAVSIELKLAKGPVVEIGELEFDGLKRTDPDFLRRFVRLTEGDTLTASNLRAAEKAVSSVPFLTHHATAEVIPRAGYTTADLLFTVEEKKQFRLEGGAGYLPGDDAGLVWHLRTEILNLFGQGREVALFSERREKGRNRLSVQYRQPIFIAGTGTAELNVTTRDYRSEFYEFAAGGELTSDLSLATTVGVGFQWKSVEPSGDGLSYRCYLASFSVDRNVLDNRLNPATGYRWHSILSYSNRRYQSGDPQAGGQMVYNETRALVALNFFGRMARQLVAHLSINYAGVETGEALPPLSELVLIGGPGTLRGYRNEQFAVVRSAYVSVEPQFRFEAGSLFGFYDAAYLNERVARSDESVRTNEFFRHGYGFGLTLQDRNRRIKLSLSWNPDIRFDEPRLSIEVASDL